MSSLRGRWQRQGGDWGEVGPLGPLARPQAVPAMLFAVVCVLLSIVAAPNAWANWVPAPGRGDPKIRIAPYSRNRVYRLYGYVGYQIDIEFARGERFKGLAAGDIEGIAFKAQGRHLFIKPRVSHLRTNLTVLTNRRSYEFDYSVSPAALDPAARQVIYALRFSYPRRSSAVVLSHVKQRIGAALARGPATPRNYDYWYCGNPNLKPEAVWDNGLQTWIRFGARQALPAIFVLGADGSESLVNFDVRRGDVVVQRVVRRLMLRRGKLKGCIVNEAFRSSGTRLKLETVSPSVDRINVP